MLISLTHPEDNYELWIDPAEIIVMERYIRKRSSAILTLADDRPDVTAIVLKSGKTMACKETPSEIFAIMNKHLDNTTV
jgi:hypothetical protein